MKYSFLYYSDVFYKINFAILYLYNLIRYKLYRQEKPLWITLLLENAFVLNGSS